MFEKGIKEAFNRYILGNLENKKQDKIVNEIRPRVKVLEIQQRNGLEIHVLKMQDMNVEKENIKRFQLGESMNHLSNGKLIFVGETGSGKTTLVNSIVNNLLGVKYSDNFRYSLFDLKNKTRSESESQTDAVTEYTINYIDGMNRKCNFVFVDTPGLEDTRGVEVQKENIQQILKYIREHPSKVGLVIQSSTCRLTAEQKSILLDMKALIEAGNITSLIVLSTFADSDSPSVIGVLDGFEIPYTHLFLFNNNALYSRNQGISANDLLSFTMNWNASNRSIETLLDFLRPDVKTEAVKDSC
ncbi:unnamed protein product [Meganyctiphanes norvegica]|uniref:Septin-type G domain-containing protein n=1 Tax=Meganyctiphanes norvegica TaxID=48144 RepID=A0AAV2SPR6_MEGNR